MYFMLGFKIFIVQKNKIKAIIVKFILIRGEFVSHFERFFG